MVEIISKQDGPRREDVHMKRVLQDNRGIITKLADHLSNGQYSRSKQPSQTPRPDGLIIHVVGDAGKAAPEPEPQIRVSTNGRVLCVDISTGRQIQHFGDIQKRNGSHIFRLATAANRFIAPLDDATADTLGDLDGVAVGDAYSKDDLAADIGRRLDIPWRE